MNIHEAQFQITAGAPMSTRYVLADLVIDLEERSARREDELIRLTDLSFAVLAELVKNAPHPVSSENLALSVWQTPHVTDETIAQRIKLLRRVLEDDPKAPRYIRTVRGAGYACVEPVHRLTDQALPPRTRFWRKFASAAGAALAVISISIIFYSWFWDAPDGGERNGPAPPSVVGSLLERAQAQLQVQQAEETDRAIELLHHAFALDSSNPKVHIALSFALSTRVTKFRATDEDVVEAEAMARRALMADSRTGSAWHALGYALDAQGRVDEAISSYRRAFELNPSDVAAMSSAAYLLSIRGRLYEALVLEARAMEGDRYSRYADTQIALVLDLISHPGADRWRSRAQLLNPNQVVVLAEAAESHLRRGKPDAALEVLAQASGRDGGSPRLLHLSGRAALSRGDSNNARTEFVAAGNRAASDLAALNSLSGAVASAELQLKLAETKMINGDSWPGLRVQVAELHAALGDDEAALNLLSQAVDLGWRDAGALEQSPFLQRTVNMEAWATIRRRIERELAIQRTLIEGAPELIRILEEKG